MRYTPQIEEALVRQITAEPEREVILPSWAYWKGVDTPWIYVDGMPISLPRHLHGLLIGPIPDGAGLSPKPGTVRGNVNPHLFIITPGTHARARCPNGHEYTEDDWIPNVGHRCQACRAARLLGTPSIADINRSKTVCPQGHPLVKRKNGRRRCRECPRIQQAAYLKRKREGTS